MSDDKKFINEYKKKSKNDNKNKKLNINNKNNNSSNNYFENSKLKRIKSLQSNIFYDQVNK
jgi:hypothetical protein